MNDLFVSYDLRKPTRNYQPLWDELKRLGGRRTLESVWEIQSHNSAKQLRNHLTRYIDANDGLLVMDVKEWAGRGLLAWPATTTEHV